MALRGTWGAAKSTAMALHSLVTTRFPQDAIQIIGFSSTAQVLRPETLAELSVDTLQGTNLQHGLMLARRFLAHHRDAEPVVLVVTDGEPTAHLEDDGTPFFCWPPMPETIARTVAEVERVARTGATVNVFALDPDPGLVHFVHDLTQRAGGRVFQPDRRAARRVRRRRLPAHPPRPPRPLSGATSATMAPARLSGVSEPTA